MSQFRNIIISKTKPFTQLGHCFFNESPVPTDIYVTSNWSRVQLSISFNSSSNNVWCYGARTSSTSSDRFQLQSSTQYSRYNFTLDSNNSVYCNVTDIAERTDFDIDANIITTMNSNISDTNPVGESYGFIDGAYPICIGGLQNGANVATARMVGYFWENVIYINNLKSHEIAPVKDKDGIICLCDLYTDKLYYPISGTTILEDDPNA